MVRQRMMRKVSRADFAISQSIRDREGTGGGGLRDDRSDDKRYISWLVREIILLH
ncbi:hypothetical protein M569_09058 [Genlisea aurea]|uniref:Uncharacterized protein n=1 Tax=Genlisea aurea TaxID=192259 RepID=S8CFM2_9LAMI|nr:hypothetical protein M569_09058 [Genlisea aurea]